jgi:hypothetical protein
MKNGFCSVVVNQKQAFGKMISIERPLSYLSTPPQGYGLNGNINIQKETKKEEDGGKRLIIT